MILLKPQKTIVKKYSGLALLSLKDVPLPPPLGPPFKALRKPIDAFLYNREECRLISKSRNVIAKHCNKMHEWKSSKNDREH